MTFLHWVFEVVRGQHCAPSLIGQPHQICISNCARHRLPELQGWPLDYWRRYWNSRNLPPGHMILSRVTYLFPDSSSSARHFSCCSHCMSWIRSIHSISFSQYHPWLGSGFSWSYQKFSFIARVVLLSEICPQIHSQGDRDFARFARCGSWPCMQVEFHFCHTF